jgi:hypothetical protein
MSFTQFDTQSLPTWLSAPDPVPETTRSTQITREVLHASYEALFMRVIDEMSRGKGLHQVLKSDNRGIDYNDFYRWIKKDSQRKALYEEAQELLAELRAGELVEIADAEDSIEDVNRSKLKIETRKWLMGMHYKKRYGETKTIEMNTSISITDALAQAQQRLIEGEIVNRELE